MLVKDIMTKDVHMIAPDAEVRAAARLMAEAGISALPVIDERQSLLGIVSEGDLLRRAELRTARRPSWWLEFFSTPETLAQNYIKAHARKVRDVMSRPVITVGEEAPLADVAAVLERHRIKRVLVVKDGAVVGVVSRADLVRVLARQGAETSAETSDGDIRNTFLQRYKAQPWTPAGAGVGISVAGGVVDLTGFVASTEQRDALAVMAETIPGVVKVVNELRVMPALPAGI